LHTQKAARTRSTKPPDPEPDSDDQEDNPRGTRSRTAKATKTPARPPARSTATARSRATPSVAETDEPSGSDIVEVTKPRARGSKRKAKDETTTVEEGDSEETSNPLRKSTRAKKTRGVFKDIEVDVNFEESKSRQPQHRRSTRSRSKAPPGDSDSDLSVKSVRSTRSTRSTKSTRSTTTKSKGKAKARSVVEETEEEEDAATPIQTLKKSTRAVAPPKSAKGRKLVTREPSESESSEVPPPPKLPKSTSKSRRKVIESGSEDWQSAQEDVAPTPRPSTTKKARGRPPKVTKTPKAPPEPSPTPISNASRVSGSYMSESELHIPVREDPSKVKKPTAKAAVQPFHAKPSNQNHASTESQSRAQPLASSRLLSIGSKENADDKNTIVIDASDDEDDTMRFVASKSTMHNSTSLNPSRVNGVSTSTTTKPKSTISRKRESFVGVILSSSPRVTHQSTGARGKVVERSRADMDVDEVLVLDQPSRSAETDHDSPVAVNKSKGKVTAAPTKPKPSLSISEQKQEVVVQSEASDSAMDVDDRDDHEVQDIQSTRDLRQPSTPRRDPPRKLLGDDSNPFTTAPQRDSSDATNPLSVFEAPYGRIPTEVIYALGEEEKEMTVEEWTKGELEIQLELFKEHGLRKIREFKERAAEVRRQIEAL